MRHEDRVRALVDQHMEKVGTAINKQVIDEANAIWNHIAIFLVGQNVWLLWRAIKSLTDKAHKKCGTLEISDKRDICIQKAKLKDTEKRLKFIQKRQKDCKDKKDPDKCKEAGKTIIKNLKARKKEIKKKLKKLEKRLDKE